MSSYDDLTGPIQEAIALAWWRPSSRYKCVPCDRVLVYSRNNFESSDGLITCYRCESCEWTGSVPGGVFLVDPHVVEFEP